MTHQLYPCLWFDGQAKAAADFYCSIFPDSKICSENPMVVIFQINGSKFMGLNGGPMFQFNEATSFVIPCDTQEEIDFYWNALTADGGMESMCGWLKDKFGFSWQVIPSFIDKIMSDPDKGAKSMQAMMQMKKLDIDKLLNP
ncbi:MAG: VOC family protein [Bacteroidota bacterium]